VSQEHTGEDRIIRIAAAVILDGDGRMLVVRKSGTDAFMQPGGKLEPGESAAECLARELHEELALVVALDELEPLGRFGADAANEAGWRVDCDVFRWAGALRLASLAQGAAEGASLAQGAAEGVPLAQGVADGAATAQGLVVQAELAEARWCGRDELLGLAADGVLAPLTRDNLELFLLPSTR